MRLCCGKLWLNIIWVIDLKVVFIEDVCVCTAAVMHGMTVKCELIVYTYYTVIH